MERSSEIQGSVNLRFDLTVGDGDLRFVWGEPPLGGDEASFVLEGTKIAQLVVMVSAEQAQKIMADNPRASGFNPVIYMNREAKTDKEKQTEGSAEEWEIGTMLRLINTAEAQYKFAHGIYANYATLLRSGQLKETGGSEFTLLPRNLRSETDPLPGYRLRLLISQDGSSYQLSIQETTADCGTGLFSDETGVISKATPLTLGKADVTSGSRKTSSTRTYVQSGTGTRLGAGEKSPYHSLTGSCAKIPVLAS